MRVFLKMSNLIRRAVHEINGPKLHVCTTICETELKTVSVSFDATKFPFQIKCGLPESFVSFAAAKFLRVQEAELDIVRKVVDYLTYKFAICIITTKHCISISFFYAEFIVLSTHLFFHGFLLDSLASSPNPGANT